MKNTFSEDTRGQLENISTATLATALFKAGFKNQFILEVSTLHIH